MLPQPAPVAAVDCAAVLPQPVVPLRVPQPVVKLEQATKSVVVVFRLFSFFFFFCPRRFMAIRL